MVNLPELCVVGISVRTNNAFEINPSEGKIEKIALTYFRQKLFENIPHRKKPGTTYCIYTNYASDFTGDYTFLIGEEVSSFEGVPSSFETLIISAQNYKKFTSERGQIPSIGIKLWQQIWANAELNEQRAYKADFEIYDERSSDHQNAVMDIYISVK